MPKPRWRPSPLVLTVTLLAWSTDVSAQWYFDGYAGANYTHPANVSIDVPGADVAVVFHQVRFDAEPFAAPIYYGGRFGRLLGRPDSAWRFGVEGEFIHMKVYADTAGSYLATGHIHGVTADGELQLNVVAQRYAMSHGLNFLLGNVVLRRRLGDRVAFAGRAGLGVTLPHAESTILGTSREQYEFAGFGGHGAAGFDFAIAGPLGALVEYKLTYARPEIDVSGGTGRTSSLTHHFAFGFRVGGKYK